MTAEWCWCGTGADSCGTVGTTKSPRRPGWVWRGLSRAGWRSVGQRHGVDVAGDGGHVPAPWWRLFGLCDDEGRAGLDFAGSRDGVISENLHHDLVAFVEVHGVE